MADFDINHLDFNNIGGWPIVAQGVTILILCVALLGAGYWFHTQEQIARLDQEKIKEVNLRKEFEDKQTKANGLEKLKQQLAEIEASFGTMLQRLPSETEVDKVLVDISQTGLANGLNFELFKPGTPKRLEFHAELPIAMKMTGGNYHALGHFVSDVAGLQRIVTQHDISIQPEKGGLVMESTAKTYHLAQEEGVK